MSRSTLSEAARAAIVEKLGQTPAGERGDAIAELAQTFDAHPATIYRAASLGGAPRPRKKDPELRKWTRIAVAWRQRVPGGAPLDLAIEAAVAAGELPEAALRPSFVKTAERIRRELGLQEQPARTHRLHADYPMQAILFDASTSKHLVVDKNAGFGDATRLKLHEKPTPSSGYKNKPVPADRRRVIGYALWDMCTGIVRSRYTVSRGENAVDSIKFLCWALARSDDRRVVLHGVPDDLWVDQGSLIKAAVTRDLLERLDINTVVGPPYAKARMGGVEGSHKTRFKRFESTLFWRGSDAITLGQLNARLAEYEIRESQRLSRTRVDGRLCTRTQAWVALTNRRADDNPLHELPERPAETLAREGNRRIDNNGIIRFHGVEYESTDWHARWVVVHQALDGSGHIVLTDVNDRTEKRTARRYAPRAYGEIRAAAATELAKLVAADAERKDRKHADVYAPDAAAKSPAPWPARTAPARPLENPLDGADRCRDIDEAMALVVAHFGRIPRGEHSRVRALVERTGLDRQAVIALAQTLRKAV